MCSWLMFYLCKCLVGDHDQTIYVLAHFQHAFIFLLKNLQTVGGKRNKLLWNFILTEKYLIFELFNLGQRVGNSLHCMHDLYMDKK